MVDSSKFVKYCAELLYFEPLILIVWQTMNLMFQSNGYCLFNNLATQGYILASFGNGSASADQRDVETLIEAQNAMLFCSQHLISKSIHMSLS